MKKVKIGFWLLVVAFCGLLYFQNQKLFQQINPFNLNLYFIKYQTQELYNGVAFAICFLAGLVIAFLYTLWGSVRTRKTIKQLNKDLDDQRSQIDSLNTELNAFKSAAPIPAENPVVGDDEASEAEATKVLS